MGALYNPPLRSREDPEDPDRLRYGETRSRLIALCRRCRAKITKENRYVTIEDARGTPEEPCLNCKGPATEFVWFTSRA